MADISESKASPRRDEPGENPNPPSRPSLRLHSIFWFTDNLDWLLILVGTVGAVGNGLAIPLYLFLFGKILNGFGESTDISKYLLYAVYVGIGACVASWAEISCWMHTAERQTAKMRYKYLQAILKQDIAVFDTEMRTGAVLDSLSTDFLLIQDALGEKMGSFIRHLATVFGGFVFSLMYVYRVSLVLLAIVPLVILGGALYASALSKVTSRRQNALGAAATIAEEVVAQIRTVYSFVGECKAIESYTKKLETTVKLGYHEGLIKGVGLGVIKGIAYAEWTLICWYAGVLIRNGTANAGESVSSIFNILLGIISIGSVLASLTSIAKGRAAHQKVVEIINGQPRSHKSTSGVKPEEMQGDIEFKTVFFSYPSRPDVMVLQEFSLHVPAGNTFALVGSSGSGKSTVISLLEQFYEPSKGQILVDNYDIKTLDTKWLRQQVGLVSQEPVLFSTSIKQNIMHGKEDAKEEEVIAAAKAANAHDFVTNLPQGYDTKVGVRGIQLSGGQKQRIAIARAIVKNPKILLLDEATSALDSSSEHLVQMALNDIMIGRTTVVVAHRLLTVKRVDTIAVMIDGRIVEVGNHDELMAKGDTGAYFSLVKLQTANFSSEIDQNVPGMPDSSGNEASRPELQAYESEVNRKKKNSETETENVQSKASTWRVLKMCVPDLPFAVLATLGSILLGCLPPLFAFFISETIAIFYLKDDAEMERKLRIKTFIFVGLAAFPMVGNTLQHYSLGIMGENLSKRVREKMLAAILRNEVGWFDNDENSSLRISSRLSLDATNVKTVIGEILIIVQNIANLVVSLAVCFKVLWQMSLVLLATFPLLTAATIAQRLSMQKGFGGDQAEAHSEATAVAGEAVSNIRTLSAFNGEDKVLSLFQHLLSKPLKRSFRRGHVVGFIYGLSQLGMFSSYGLAFWHGSRLVHKHSAKFSDVIIVYMVLVVSSFAVSDTMILAPDIAKGREAVKSVFKILDRQTLMEPEDPKGFFVEDLKGEIEFSQVKFCYPSRPQVTVLENLNLKLEAGNNLALVGASGCGKSSIISLIERFYDPVSGMVMIDGMDIRTVHLRSLRMHIALVQQEPALFATSIRDNILYGNGGAMEEEVIKAATTANAHDFISKLPDGYRTVVGERGVEMSGGQKQRLAIARAVLKNPRILLLDEATSGLDAESESVVQEALDRVMEGRTSIVVAHRLSTIKNVSTIAVLKNGHIAEQGSHSQLLATRQGEYCRLLNINADPMETPTSIIE